jgi:hypothetical protein
MVLYILTHFTLLLIIDCTIPFRGNNQNFNTPCKRYSAGDYVLHYNTLLTYDWPALYNETSVDAAVDRLKAAVAQAINLAVPCGCVTKYKYAIWFSVRLRSYIKKKTYFIAVIKSTRQIVFTTDFLFIRN